MSIDRDTALAAVFPEGEGSYGANNVILYHLGLGAGNPPDDPNELEYTYEKHLKVLPTFAIAIPSSGGGNILNVPGLDFDPTMMLHGEQDIEVHKPLPTSATVKTTARITDIYDKGSAALVILEAQARDAEDEPIFTTRASCFLRGEGGFGGPSGPKASNAAPDRLADGSFEMPTLPQQALLYRLNGDDNPLHADPDFAKRAGFDKPIIHGLCTYGIACKGIVDHVLEGDVTKIARYQARFSGVGFPGETFVICYWREGQKIFIRVRSKERDADIITHAVITVR